MAPRTKEGVRRPAVAGRFYPGDPAELQRAVQGYLEAAAPGHGEPPEALVAPHAGYVYSGPVAGSAYALVSQAGDRFRRVVLAGPSHFVAFEGLALPESRRFATPLGEHVVDVGAVEDLADHPAVRVWDAPHRDEHSLEVQLPFVRRALGSVPVVPLVVGHVTPETVAEVLERAWTSSTLVIVSSDLSHYEPYDRARARDRRTADAVEALDASAIGPEDACGYAPLTGLLVAARRRCLTPRTVDLRSSGDTHGSHRRVVGYGAFGFWASEPASA